MLDPISITRRALMTGAGAALAFPAASQPAAIDWHALGRDVRSEMRWAWRNYRKRAWGKDEIKPISGTFSSFPLKNHHLGLSLIEALDTLWIMELDDEFHDGVAWVKSNLD